MSRKAHLNLARLASISYFSPWPDPLNSWGRLRKGDTPWSGPGQCPELRVRLRRGDGRNTGRVLDSHVATCFLSNCWNGNTSGKTATQLINAKTGKLRYWSVYKLTWQQNQLRPMESFSSVKVRLGMNSKDGTVKEESGHHLVLPFHQLYYNIIVVTNNALWPPNYGQRRSICSFSPTTNPKLSLYFLLESRPPAENSGHCKVWPVVTTLPFYCGLTVTRLTFVSIK